MKKLFTKIKTVLATLWIGIISFSSKVLWKTPIFEQTYKWHMQTFYWVPSAQEYRVIPISAYAEPTTSLMDTIIKIAPRLLVAVTFIIWVVSFIKIRKIDDETLKKKKIKNTIIISTLIILILLLLLLPRFLKKYL